VFQTGLAALPLLLPYKLLYLAAMNVNNLEKTALKSKIRRAVTF
jgi:hypothetical protein